MAKLTIKQRGFIKELIATRNPTEAAFRAYNCKDRNVAGVIAHENLRKLNISFSDLMEKMGLTLEEDIKDLKRLRKAKRVQSCDIYVDRDDDGNYKVNENSNDFMEVDDNNAQLKALDLTTKLKGFQKTNGNNVDNSVHITNIIQYGATKKHSPSPGPRV